MTAQPTEPAMPDPTNQPSSRKPAYVYASQRDWPAYFDVVAGKPPRETLTAALDAFEAEGRPTAENQPPLAIDLGCGEGRDTAELLGRGWRVLAIDGHPDAIRRLGERDDLVPADRVEIRYEPFEGLVLPRAMLVNASFSLPFCPPEHFEALWAAICEAIEPGGRFAGQFFGDRDDWAPIPDRSHQTRAEAEALLARFEVELFEEVEDDSKDALENPKHWHRFDVVARKPGRKGSS
ncbi:SAM-dependent methyltransferase [hydrothermal vent metagenome]|uniref:SAM-dependent methyltransferase n=1 Tax=hydrothermal vent metagenome TaxID=652676 RepID=A0A3B1DGU8_9ZZZZ